MSKITSIEINNKEIEVGNYVPDLNNGEILDLSSLTDKSDSTYWWSKQFIMPYNGFVKFTFRAVQSADTETLNKFVISSSTNEIDIDSFASIPNQVSSSFIAPWGLNALTSHLIPKGHYVRIYTRISTYTKDHQITIYPTKVI